MLNTPLLHSFACLHYPFLPACCEQGSVQPSAEIGTPLPAEMEEDKLADYYMSLKKAAPKHGRGLGGGPAKRLVRAGSNALYRRFVRAGEAAAMLARWLRCPPTTRPMHPPHRRPD